jgi:hypothetical protein
MTVERRVLKLFAYRPFLLLGPAAVGRRIPSRANHPKGWDAKLLAYVLRKQDTAAELPGTHTLLWAV